MFESHFGFSSSPFALNPDPAFFFASKGHARALAYLKYGVFQREGFIVVTGEIGSGKTTLVRALLENLNPDEVVAAQVRNTQLDSSELLHAICTAFGVPVSGPTKAHMLASLEAYFTALAAGGKRALLIVDEAQNLGLREIEELRMLSNFQFGSHALVQSFLIGQPELRQLLRSNALEQLSQRIIAACHLGPLGPDETRSYIEHRLAHVGWNGRPAFDADTFERIQAHTGGIPRRINLLCSRLLLAAWLGDSTRIDVAAVELAAEEMHTESFGSGPEASSAEGPTSSETPVAQKKSP
jgi:putative secretion ATPase (PEP-CTERM system associated)